MALKMDEAVSQVKNAIVSGRTDIINTVLDGCRKFGQEGTALHNKILRENLVPEGTFLHLATKLGLQDVVRTLLMSGADPTIENKQGENPFELAQTEVIQQVYVEELLRATANSELGRIDDLLKAGLDPNSYDCQEKRNTVLHWAVSFANTYAVTFIIERGGNVNAETTEGVTPLHDAVDRGDLEIIELLLKANASPLIKADKGKFEYQSPLDLASRKPEVFSLMSHFLAAQFKTRSLTKRSSSIESVSVFSNGPESPPYTNTSAFRSRENQLSGSGSGDFNSIVHSGFNSDLEGVIRGLELKAPIQPIVTDSHLSNLWPQPKHLMCLEGLHFRPEKLLHVSVVQTPIISVHRILDIFSCHKDVFESLGFRATCSQIEGAVASSANISTFHSSQIQCCVNSEVLPVPSSYRLHISSQKVRITAADLPGLRYAICTFLQLLTLYSHDSDSVGIPSLIINDNPSLKHRAVFIDVSQERIPTIANLCELIRSLSLLKINFLHLHTRFDKTGALLSYTKGEIVAIDRWCEDAGVTLVPAIDIQPSSITSAEYFTSIKPVLHDVLPCFASSKYIHVGPQLTALMFTPENETPDSGFRTIWDFIPVSQSESIVMLCYNAVRTRIVNPSALLHVPSNVILVEYGFQADYNFGPSIQELTQNGCNTMVCAGTSAWSSLAGAPEAALSNIYNATLNAVNNSSSIGLIVANWSGSCNFTPKLFAWPGFLLASGLSWNHQTHWEYLQGSLATLMSTYVVKDKAGISGQVILQLGCAESNLLRAGLNQSPNDMSNLPPTNGTILYRLLADPDNVTLDYLTLEAFIKCVRSVKKCQTTLLLESKMVRENNPVFEELCLTIELMLLGCKIGRSLLVSGINPRSNMGLTVVNLGISNLPPTVRTDIANKMLILTEEYQRIWMIQNYPQGLETSLYTLTSVLQRFIPDSSRLLTGRLSSTSSLTTGSMVMVNGQCLESP